MNERQNPPTVVIAGGGMVGSALALALGRAGVSVAVLEPRPASPLPQDAPTELRCSAISPASRRLLQAVGVWEVLQAQRVSPYRHMHVWDSESPARLVFSASELGLTELGWIIENRRIQSALWQALQYCPGVRCLNSPLAGWQNEEGGLRVQLEDGTELRTRLLVGADGRQSRVRQQAGIPLRTHPYAQQALVAVVATERSHEHTAWQRFLPTGPLAFLPLDDGTSSIVWTVDDAEAERLRALDEAAFNAELTAALDARLGPCRLLSPLAAFPLQMQRAGAFVGARLALVGDAAHVVHPLAGQGVNLGFLDAAALAEVVVDALRRGEDVGDARVLNRYQRWRKADTLMTQEFMTLLQRLFGSRNPALVGLRGLGMALVDRSVLKKAFAWHVAGQSDDHPRLSRGEPLGSVQGDAA